MVHEVILVYRIILKFIVIINNIRRVENEREKRY